MIFSKNIIVRSIALLMGAMLLFSCDKGDVALVTVDPKNKPTQISRNHKLLQSKNGVNEFRGETPLLEKYDNAEDPYMEFREGIRIEMFSQEHNQEIESRITADYAHYNINKELWEARGNVVGVNEKEERTVLTEQLFWDQRAKKYYTNEAATVIDKGNIYKGVGLVTDEDFRNWEFNRARGQLEVEEQASDSTSMDSPEQMQGGVPPKEPESKQPPTRRNPALERRQPLVKDGVNGVPKTVEP